MGRAEDCLRQSQPRPDAYLLLSASQTPTQAPNNARKRAVYLAPRASSARWSHIASHAARRYGISAKPLILLALAHDDSAVPHF